MTTEDLMRRLSAILSADVEGYSLLMREDEQATVHTLTAYRTAMTHLINQYRGRVVDSPGDNILAEFTSVVDAVNCGVEIQRALAERNAELPENRRMQFRIGINLGDVLEEGERIYGDGVNIAARMESLAEAGEICISGTVYDAIEAKIGLRYEYLGEKEVKNIDKPVRAYRVLSFPGAAAHRVVKAKRAVEKTWRNVVVAIVAVLLVGVAFAVWHFYLRPSPPSVEIASEERVAFPLPDRPSIAVLPFTNISRDQEQEYFSDGITDNIITDLSKLRGLFVVARSSAFAYKGQAVDVRQVGRELGVRHVLEGGVQKILQQIRINVQLVDTVTGDHIWAERYDRDFEDIFALQDEITRKIVTELNVKLVEGEQARMWSRGTDNPEAYDYFLRANEVYFRMTQEDNALARMLSQKAIDLDPKFAAAVARLGQTYYMDAIQGWSESPEASWEQVLSLCQRALELDDALDLPYRFLGLIALLRDGDHEQALKKIKRAVALNPNGADNLMFYALTLNRMGDPKGLEFVKKAMRLNPNPPAWYLSIFGGAYWLSEQHEEAIAALTRCCDQIPDYIYCRVKLVLALMDAGREAEGRAQAREVLRINPRFSSATFADDYTSPTRERVATLLQQAGLK